MRNILVLTFCLFAVGEIKAQVYGCTDPLATNYNSSATTNDGSCVYAAGSVSPTSSFNLTDTLPETSGLIQWNNQVWTHNDNTDINLYSLDTADGNFIQAYPLPGTVNIDWEEISQDSSYIYVGDFGNNLNGNRTDLKILRIDKSSLLFGSPAIDTIYFSYSNQTNFTPTGSNNTDFDCEAFVVSGDSIFLFTKQWVSNKTSVYALPKTPGTYVAGLKIAYDVQGLITGALLLENEKIIALSGYSNLLQPFMFLLYDFSGTDYFSGNKRKISVSLPFHQVEGITTSNGLKYYLTNEYFSQPPVTTQQKLHILDLTSYLGNYLNGLSQGITQLTLQQNVLVYPNPADREFTIYDAGFTMPDIEMYDMFGKKVFSQEVSGQWPITVNISELRAGVYFVKVGSGSKPFRLIKN